MAKMSTDELLDQFKEMTLLELSEFIKQFEETFDVKAAAAGPVMMAAPGGGGGGGAEAEEEQSEFDVVLTGAGRQEDPGHQGGARAHQPGPEGGQGPGRRCAPDGPGEGHQGSRRQGEGDPRGRRSLGRGQVGVRLRPVRHVLTGRGGDPHPWSRRLGVRDDRMVRTRSADMKETFHLPTARAKVRRGIGSAPDRWPRRCAT